NRLPPRGDVIEPSRPRIHVAEHRLDALPTAPPIFARGHRLAAPFLGPPVPTEGLAQGPRWIDRQFLGVLEGQVLRRCHSRRGRRSGARLIPPPIPFLGACPGIRPVGTTRHRTETSRLHFLGRLPECFPALHDVVANLDPRHRLSPRRIASIRSLATALASRACIAAAPPNRWACRASHHRSIATISKLPVSGSGAGKPRAINFGSNASKAATDLPSRRAATSAGTSRGSTRKRIASILEIQKDLRRQQVRAAMNGHWGLTLAASISSAFARISSTDRATIRPTPCLCMPRLLSEFWFCRHGRSMGSCAQQTDPAN